MKERWLPWLLGLLGCAGMVGDVAGFGALKGLAAATAASPAPKVFSSVRGLETFSTEFEIAWRDRDEGAVHVLPLDKTIYPLLRGPYNRRNAYGAILAFGPVLASTPVTVAMYEAAAQYGLCGAAPILAELGIAPEDTGGVVMIRYRPRAGSAPDPALPMTLTVECHR